MLTKSELSYLIKEYKLKATPNSRRLLAYNIGVDTDPIESTIVFAKSEKEASRMADEIGIGDYTEVDWVYRKPEFDKYADQGYVPNSELYKDGWQFECDWCGRRVCEWEEEEYYSELDDWNELTEEEKSELEPPEEYNPQFTDKDLVFCCTDCQTSWHTEAELSRKRKADVVNKLKAKYPGITNIGMYGGWREDRVQVSFKFPGGEYDVTYDSNDPDVVMVAKGDLEAWYKYRGD